MISKKHINYSNFYIGSGRGFYCDLKAELVMLGVNEEEFFRIITNWIIYAKKKIISTDLKNQGKYILTQDL